MTEMLAAERIREMVARGDAARRARQARLAYQPRQARQARTGLRAPGHRLPGQWPSPSCPGHGRARKTQTAEALLAGRAPRRQAGCHG